MKDITKNTKNITKHAKSITKKQLIDEIYAAESDIAKTTIRTVLEEFLKIACNHIATGGRIEIRDFGVFLRVLRRKKIGRNPKKAKVPIIIPERFAIKFIPGKRMKELLQESDAKRDTTSVKESSPL